MSVLIFAELSGGKLKKPAFEAATYGFDLAQSIGGTLSAVVIGAVDASEIAKLGNYGVAKIYHINEASLNVFNESAFASAIAEVAKKAEAKFVVLPQTYNGRAAAPRLSVKLDAALFSGVIALATVSGEEAKAKRTAYSGKAIEEIGTKKGTVVITIKANSYPPKQNSASAAIESFAFSPSAKDMALVSKEIKKASDKISLTEADVVVSAGRGLKGPENWGMVEQLADLLGAATACSKPVADVHWRPHHEHVGQTGIQIAPNVYIAIGISGAIQHLAGVNASKTIICVNKDPEAPFFKAADYGIVGDAFDVVPKLIDAIKAHKH